MRIVLDTNVFISALLFGGNPRKIIEKIISGDISKGDSIVIQNIEKELEIIKIN